MIAEQVVQRSVRPHGDALTARIVILGDSSIRHFVVTAHKIGGVRADAHIEDGFYPLVVAVVNEGCVYKDRCRGR